MEHAIIDHIRIILVGTTHPGNIGAAARAMKTMGLGQLCLVGPKIFPTAEATARAAGADDVLENALLCDSVFGAVRDCTLVFGTTARERSISWPVLTPAEAAEQSVMSAGNGEAVAFLFGRESIGLTNEELNACNRIVSIPCNPGFSSLNLAAAVQIVCYELRKSMQLSADDTGTRQEDYQPVTAEDMSRFYEHLERTLIEIGFLDPDKPRRLMRRMRRLFNRARPDRNEYNILRGILSAVQGKSDAGEE